MLEFNDEELRMIKRALITEICQRENNPNTDAEKLRHFESLYEKVYSVLKEANSLRSQ